MKRPRIVPDLVTIVCRELTNGACDGVCAGHCDCFGAMAQQAEHIIGIVRTYDANRRELTDPEPEPTGEKK